MLSPPLEGKVLDINEIPFVTNISTEFLTYETLPENVKLLIPFPSVPFVTI